MELSVVIPVYQSHGTLRVLIQSLQDSLQGISYEIILVNDGSRDGSESLIMQLADEHNNINAISLRRNFGENRAVMCGLTHAIGKYIVIMDDDMQHPPSEIHKLLHQIKNGYDVVYSKYLVKQHHWVRNIFSKVHSYILNFLLGSPKQLYLSSFKIMTRELAAEICHYTGPFPHIDGLVLRTTQHIGVVKTIHLPRAAGKSNYSFSKLMQLYLDMLVNFSIKPLRYFTLIGLFIFITGLLLSGYYLYSKLSAAEPPGWTSTVIFILLLSGFQILFLGLISEYVGRQYLHQNQTPQYSIRKSKLKNTIQDEQA